MGMRALGAIAAVDTQVSLKRGRPAGPFSLRLRSYLAGPNTRKLWSALPTSRLPASGPNLRLSTPFLGTSLNVLTTPHSCEQPTALFNV